MADPLFTPEVRHLLDKNDTDDMRTFCETLHPATVAEALTDSFSVEEMWRFLTASSIDQQATVFAYLPMDWQLQMAEDVGRQQMASLIEEMSSDDRADLLRRLPAPVRENLLRLVDEADRRDIAKLIEYPENTAGAIMTTDYAWLPANISAEEALQRLRLQAPDKETIYYIFIVDEQRRLTGVLSLRELILARRGAMVSDLMETNVVFAHDTDDREKVAHDFAEYDLLVMPVVDADRRLVGIITSDDVFDVVVSEATEDVHRMGGVGPLEDEYLETSFFTLWRNRAFWLSCLFIGQMFTFNAMAHFEGALQAMTVLALFVPLCISTGGNSGSQAATLINRALALGQVTVGDWARALRHELAMGLALGVTLGVIAALRTWLLTPAYVLENPGGRPDTDIARLTLVISVAVFAICLYGTLIGAMLPLGFKWLGADPGVASTPFVATFVDVTGILIYFSIARAVFGVLME